jgi:phosphoglycerate-specific signal transduction histidine kinase
LIDIHERKIAEESLLRFTRNLEQRVADEVEARLAAEEQLRQSQKLEAIGGLTGGVAHDFNNLLQVIAGNLHLLARHEPNNANVQRRVAASIAAVERGAKLSTQLLAFARRQPLSPAIYTLSRFSMAWVSCCSVRWVKPSRCKCVRPPTSGRCSSIAINWKMPFSTWPSMPVTP